MLAIGELGYSRLDVPPELGAPVGGLEPQGQGKLAVDVDPAEIGLRHIDHLVAVGIKVAGYASQGRGLADTCLAGEKRHTGSIEELLEALLEEGDLAIVP